MSETSKSNSDIVDADANEDNPENTAQEEQQQQLRPTSASSSKNSSDLEQQSDSKRKKSNHHITSAEPVAIAASTSTSTLAAPSNFHLSVDLSEADQQMLADEEAAAMTSSSASKSIKRKRNVSSTTDEHHHQQQLPPEQQRHLVDPIAEGRSIVDPARWVGGNGQPPSYISTSPSYHSLSTDEDKVKTSSNKSKKETKKEKDSSQPPLNPESSTYWENLRKTRVYRDNSLRFTDLLSRELGYTKNNGGCHFGGVGSRQRFTTRAIETMPLEFAKRTRSSLDLVRRMKVSQELSFHNGCVNALHFNGTGTMLASGSDDFQVCLWDWAKSSPVLTFDSGHKSNVFQTKFMPFTGDTQIVTCARDGQVRLALLSSSGSLIGTKKLAKHADSCHKLALETDSTNIFLSAGEDAAVYEIDLRQDMPAKILTVKHAYAQRQSMSSKVPLYSVSSNPSQSYQFIVAGKDQYVRLYDKRMLAEGKTKVLKMFTPSNLKNPNDASITSAVYNYDGSEIVASYSENDIFLFDSSLAEFSTTAKNKDIGDAKYCYKGHRNAETIKGVNFYGAKSEYIMSGSDCGRVFFWEKSTQQIVQALKGDEHGVVNVLEPHPAFPIIATSGLDNEVKIWAPVSETPNMLPNLADIVKENQRVRETSRHFSLSSFEFELLLLLMNRPNNRIFFRTRDGDFTISGRTSDSNTTAAALPATNTNDDNTGANATSTTTTNTADEATTGETTSQRGYRRHIFTLRARRRREAGEEEANNESGANNEDEEDDEMDEDEDEEDYYDYDDDDDDDDEDDGDNSDNEDRYHDDEDEEDGGDTTEYESQAVTRHLRILRRRLEDSAPPDSELNNDEATSTAGEAGSIATSSTTNVAASSSSHHQPNPTVVVSQLDVDDDPDETTLHGGDDDDDDNDESNNATLMPRSSGSNSNNKTPLNSTSSSALISAASSPPQMGDEPTATSTEEEEN